MQKAEDSFVEHLPLEEVRTEQIDCLPPPAEWDGTAGADPVPPPVLIEEDRGFTLLVHHKSLWQARGEGRISVRALVVRSAVHIPVAHRTVRNCLEEAMLFDGLLRLEIVPNRSRLAEMLGYSRARITQILNILKLPVEIRQGLLLVDHVTEFHLRPLVKIDDDRRQLSMFRKLMADKLTGRQMALFAAADGKAGELLVAEAAGIDLETLIASSGEAEETTPAPATPAETATPVEQTERPLRPEEPVHPEHIQKHHPRTLPPTEPPVTVSPAAAAQRSTHARARALLESMGTLREKGWEAEAVKLGVTGPERLFLEGVSLLRMGLYAQASEMLVQLVHTQPENAPAWFFLGRCQNLLENHPLAEQYLRTACELIPDDPDYLCELAIVLERQKRYSEASTFYRKAGSIRKAAMARGRKA